MKKLVFLAVVDVCRCLLPPLVNNGGYVQPASNLLNNAGYLVQVVPRAPVSYANPFTLYQNPYTPSYVNPQVSYAKNLYDDYMKRERLKLLYNSLASRPKSTKLSNIFNSDNRANNFTFNTVPTRRASNGLSDISKDSVFEDRRDSIDMKAVEPITPIALAESPKEIVDGDGRKYLKKITYIMKEVPPTHSTVAYSNSHGVLSKPVVQTVASTHHNSGHDYIGQNTLNSGYGTTHLMKPGLFGHPWYLPYTSVWNPTTNIRPSYGNAFNMEYNYANVKSESKEVISYIITLMLAENFISPEIIQTLSDAQNINFSKLDEFDDTHLVKMSKKVVNKLKKYLIQTINVYGLTPYTFKLLEYIHLMEGKPKSEVYLISKILADDRTIQYYNEDELNQLQRHLFQIYEDYHESPYILAFLKYVVENQVRPIQYDNPSILDLDFGIKNDEELEDFRKIYLYLSQSYDDNLNVLKILKNINDIYENVGTDIVVPVIELEDLQSLTDVSRDDLILLVKYILQVASYSGDNSYFNALLSYISQIQNSDQNTNVSIISNDNAAIKDNEEGIDLSLIYNYLMELNNTNSSKDVLIVLKRIMENHNFGSTATATSTSNTTKESRNNNDLTKIKEFLLHNPRPELNALVKDVIKKINEATKKSEVKVVLQPVILDGDHNIVEISRSDLELIYQYILKKQMAVPNDYLKQMLHFIKEAQNQIKENDKNGLIRLKYDDIMQIYKYLLQTQEKDIDNPVFVKVQQYVDQSDSAINIQHDSNNKPNVTTNITSNIHEENQIDLEAVYKFILHKTFEGQPEPLLIEMLDFLNQTFILPNGQLKLKIITSNMQKPVEGISQKDIVKILLYLKKLKENNALYNEFSQYLKGETAVKDHEDKSPFSVVSNVTLNRIKKYLRTLIEEHGENPHIQQIILEINEVLKSQHSEEDLQTIDSKETIDSSINEDDLKILLQYMSKAISVPDSNDDIAKLLEYIYESQQNMKEQSEKKRKQESLKLYLIWLLNNDDITPAIKDVLQILAVDKMFENPNSLILELKKSSKLKKLSTDELNDLIGYLHQIIIRLQNTVGAEPVSELLATVIKQKEEVENNKNNIPKQANIYTNENVNENEKDVKISGDNIKILNTYLIDLLNQYGEDDNVLHILHTINHIEDDSEKKSDLTKLMGSSSNDVTVVNIDDLKNILKYLLQLIEHHGTNPQVIKVLRDIVNFNKEPEKDFRVSLVDFNATHIAAAIDQADLNRIQRDLNIIKNFKPSPQILNILQTVQPKNNTLHEKPLNNEAEAQKIYTFGKLKHEEMNQLTEYLLKLIEKYGMLPEFLNILILVHEIYHNNYAEVEILDDINQQNVIVVSEEINGLLQQDVLNTIQSMNRDNLFNIYTQLIKKVFVSPNSWENINMTDVAEKLLGMYNSEITPVKKYILLKIYDYMTKNKELNYKTILQPEFVLVLLDLKKDESKKIQTGNITTTITEKDRNYTVVEPYDYKKDVESALMKLVENMFKTQEEPNDSILRSKNIIANYTINEISEDESHEETQLYPQKVSCLDASKKFDVIINILDDLFDLNGQKIDVSMQEFLKIYDLLNTFRKRLSLEKRGEDVPTSVMIGELERRILHGYKGRCHYQPGSTVETLMTRLVDVLREVIQHLKVNDNNDNTIKATVVSLAERVLPDISAIAVKDCEARTDKELMSMFFSNIYSSKSSDVNKLQFLTGYAVQGNTAEDFLHTLSMQRLLEDISKYKNV